MTDVRDHHNSNKLTISISCVLFGHRSAQLQEVFTALAVAISALAETIEIDADLYLVDNKARPGEHSELCENLITWINSNDLFTQVHSIVGQGNVGFGAGHNLALKKTESDFHIILNPDVWVAQSSLIEGINYLRAHSDVAMVAPAAKEMNGDTQYIAKRYPSVLILWLRAFAPKFVRRKFLSSMHHYELRDRIPANKPLDIKIASGCFMLARTSTLKDMGGFNPVFFMYFEDYDLCQRLVSQRQKIVHLPQMQIVHTGGGAARKGVRHVGYFISSAIKFFNRHGWRWFLVRDET